MQTPAAADLCSPKCCRVWAAASHYLSARVSPTPLLLFSLLLVLLFFPGEQCMIILYKSDCEIAFFFNFRVCWGGVYMCTCAFQGTRSTLGDFLSHSPSYLLRLGFSQNPELTNWLCWLASIWRSVSPPTMPLALRLQM